MHTTIYYAIIGTILTIYYVNRYNKNIIINDTTTYEIYNNIRHRALVIYVLHPSLRL